MRRIGLGVSSLVLAGAFALPGLALAESTPAPAPAPTAPAPAPTEAAAPAALTTETPQAAPTETAPPPATDAPTDAPADATPAAEAAPAAEEEAAAIPGWFRIDSDGGGVQLWAGATYPLGGVGLAMDMYVLQLGTGQSLGEFDIGPAITAGPMILTPMIGLQIDWTTKKAAALVPQFYMVGGPDSIYMELWAQYYNYSMFLDDAPDSLYTRLFVDYKLSDNVAFGPQIEPTIAMNMSEERDGPIVGMPVGANIMLSNYGTGGVFFFFLGYETNKTARESVGDNALAGRLTFVYNF